jgi:ankyrin repeat protein
VKKLKFVIAGMALGMVSAAASAQFSNHGYDFVEAVRNRDGGKATQLLESQPVGLVNSKASDGNTALVIAIARGDSDWTAYLLTEGADPNLAGAGGDTPLIAASRIGFGDAVAWLIGKGAKIDGTNRMGETALIIAVQQRRIPIIRTLLEAGANPDRADTAAGYSARDYAARDTRSREIIKLIEAKKPKDSAAR